MDNLSERAANRLADAQAKYDEGAISLQKPPEVGYVRGVKYDGLYQVETVQGTFYCRPISTGKFAIGDKVALNIPSQGIPTIGAMPR